MTLRWSYKVVEMKPSFLGLKPEAIQDQLNQLGQQGWELVSLLQNGLGVRLYLKKPQ